MSPQEKFDRAYRIRVAINQSMLHSDLPKDQWVAAKQVSLILPWFFKCLLLTALDLQDTRYLTPHIEQIQQEVEEREVFDTSNIVKPSKH